MLKQIPTLVKINIRFILKNKKSINIKNTIGSINMIDTINFRKTKSIREVPIAGTRLILPSVTITN